MRNLGIAFQKPQRHLRPKNEAKEVTQVPHRKSVKLLTSRAGESSAVKATLKVPTIFGASFLASLSFVFIFIVNILPDCFCSLLNRISLQVLGFNSALACCFFTVPLVVFWSLSLWFPISIKWELLACMAGQACNRRGCLMALKARCK